MATFQPRRFPLFKNLPKELRDHIWDLAVQERESIPKIHLFTFKWGCEDDNPWADGCGPFEDRWFHGFAPFTPPRQYLPQPAPRTWTWPQNLSGYLREIGLWNVCVESQAAMARRWRMDHGSDFDLYDLCKSARERLRDGTPDIWYLKMHAERDLFCFLAAGSEFGPRYGNEDNALPGWMRNLAFEFEPEWTEKFMRLPFTGMRGTALGGASAALLAGPRKNVWLIDYQLEPTERLTSDSSEGRQVFEGVGRKYVEVRYEDMGKSWALREGVQQPCTAEFFLRQCLSGTNRAIWGRFGYLAAVDGFAVCGILGCLYE